jgi:multisubunit Na+/H+ antiporter MnhB subunit
MKYYDVLHTLAANVYRPDTSNLPTTQATPARLDTILAVVFGLLGTIAILVIVVGGVRYIVSKGEPREMAQAKNTIIYALVGLAVCILAYSLVTFVISQI